MGYVIKRGGKKQKFIPSKIRNSIKKAAKEARISDTKTKELIKEISEPAINFYKKKRFVKTTELRKSILGRISRRAKSVATAWKKHEKRKRLLRI